MGNQHPSWWEDPSLELHIWLANITSPDVQSACCLQVWRRHVMCDDFWYFRGSLAKRSFRPKTITPHDRGFLLTEGLLTYSKEINITREPLTGLEPSIADPSGSEDALLWPSPMAQQGRVEKCRHPMVTPRFQSGVTEPKPKVLETWLQVSLSLSLYIYKYIYISLSLSVCLCLCLCLSLHTCICTYGYVRMATGNKYISPYSASPYIHMYVAKKYIHIYMYIYICPLASLNPILHAISRNLRKGSAKW